jgi:two-component system, cell cycle sensor histidine kinase and response regulator CckA
LRRITRHKAFCMHILCFFLIFLLSLNVASGVEADLRSKLSAEEIAWLNAHPVIRFSSDPDEPPLEFTDSQGRYIGMGAEYLQLLAVRLGVRFERVATNSWLKFPKNSSGHHA